MSIYEQYSAGLRTHGGPADQAVNPRVIPRYQPMAGNSTDSMMLLSQARERLLAERVNADMAKDRLALVHELRRDQRRELIEQGDEVWAAMLSRRDNPLVLGALQRSYEREEVETDWTIRHALERGW